MGDSTYLCGFIFAKFLQHPFRHLRMAVEGRPGQPPGHLHNEARLTPEQKDRPRAASKYTHMPVQRHMTIQLHRKPLRQGGSALFPGSLVAHGFKPAHAARMAAQNAKNYTLTAAGLPQSKRRSCMIKNMTDSRMPQCQARFFQKTEKSPHQTDHTTQTQANPNRAQVNPWFSDGPTWR